MREIRVHFEDAIVVVLQRVAEALDVGRPQAELAGTVQHAQRRVASAQALGQRARPIGGGVVDDQDSGLWQGIVDGLDDGRQVLRLIVGRDDD